MKKNIFVFPCGSEIGLDIYSSVCYSTYFHLIGGSSVDDHGRFVYKDYIPDIPFVNDPLFIPAMSRIVQERHIDAIYPAMDEAITILKTHEEELGCRVISSPFETTQICLSKRKTYKRLANVVKIPQLYNFTNLSLQDYPIFAKPDIGYGAKGTKKLNSREEVDSFIKDKTDILLVEFLPGEEYTVDCFTNRHGILLYSAARKRNRIKDGISVNTFFVDNQDEFQELSKKINSEMCFRGAWFYQVKRNRKGQLCLLETASRLGGSSLLSRALGVNLALLSLFDAFDFVVEILSNNYEVVLDRALESRYKTDLSFDSVYCDYDDCLIIEKKKVNTELVSFLYKCLNERKKTILLSKHNGNLEKELKSFRLDRLFDEVLHIGSYEDKAEYIKHGRPIFIDDSHAERLNIQKKLGIPVFSPDMIDVLIG